MAQVIFVVYGLNLSILKIQNILLGGLMNYRSVLLLMMNILVALSSQAKAQSAVQSEALNLLGWFHTQFQQAYEPKDIKNRIFGWDLEEQTVDARDQILANVNDDIGTYQKIFRGYFKSAHDYHVRIFFARNDSSTLPFRIQHARGRYFIGEIDRASISFADFPFYVGDEVVSFDGLDMSQAIAREEEEVRAISNPATDKTMAALHLTLELGSNLEIVRQGKVTVGVLPQRGGVAQEVSLNWNYKPPTVAASNSVYMDRAGVPMSLSPVVGPKDGPLPNLGETIWQNDPTALFRAYIFKLGHHHQIGFIRIPTMAGDQSHIDEFARLVTIMQARTSALVIDQTNNQGGQSFYTYALTSYLIQKPVATPLFRQSIYPDLTQINSQQKQLIGESASLTDLIKNLGPANFFGYPISWALAGDLLKFDSDYLANSNAGLALFGPQFRQLKTVRPASDNGATTYSKPILMLTDELDYSWADMWPAFLQDIGRVSLFGAQTAGAGGNNDTGTVPANSFGIASWSLAISTMVRRDGSYLENNGAKPDFPYSITVRDMRENYVDYIRGVRKALWEIL